MMPERTCQVRRDQSGVEDARRFAELAVAYCDPASREATVMVATELAENIVKYGEAKTGVFAGTISIALDGDLIRIRAANSVASPDDARHVEHAIRQMAAAGDVKALYRARLAELFANPGLPRSQLGLLRSAFEGRFRLSCSFVQPTLTIVAERRREPR